MKISDLFGTSRVIAFTGLAKNVGKTTAMRTALQELTLDGKRFGVTSSGRDGESFDVLDQNIPKPHINISAGNLLATTDHLLAKSGVPVKRLENTIYRTPLGRVVIVEVLQDGNFEVAGPSTASGLKAVAQRMLDQGAQYVLLDGAINRKAAASAQICDGIVLSTGAIISPDLEVVVEKTRRQVDIFRLPQVKDPEVIRIFARQKRSALVNKDYQVFPIPSLSPLDAGKIYAKLIESTTNWLLIPTAVSDHILQQLAQINQSHRLNIVAADAAKIFISTDKLDYYRERGLDLHVIRPINLLCLTANPISPEAYSFDPPDFLRRLRLAIPNIPILDVVSETNSSN